MPGEDQEGILEVGNPADFVVLSDNPLTIDLTASPTSS
jgi:predicted amidohydrolase YtcJ